jgi:hypothetical protein
MKFSCNLLRIILFILFLLLVSTYIYRNPVGDDGWFAEQSFWLYKVGIVRSNFFEGVLKWDQQLLVSHKLFILFGACLIHFFGPVLPTFQLVGFIFFCILIIQIGMYIKKRDEKTNYYLLLFLILIFSNRFMVKVSFENRPELMLAALGLISFFLIQSPNPTFAKIMSSGILSGLAILSHLNGTIFFLAGIFTLAYYRKYRYLFIFFAAGIFVSLLYFIDIFKAQNGFSLWYYQFRNDPATQKTFSLSSKLELLLTYPKFFFLGLQQTIFSIIILYVFWYLRKYFKEIPKILRVYFSFLLLSFWLITKNHSIVYAPIFIPFMIIILYEIYRIKPFSNNILKYTPWISSSPLQRDIQEPTIQRNWPCTY